MKANWKYTDSSRANIFRVNEDNSCESCAVEVITDWIAEGNTPDPADPEPLPDYSAMRSQAYRNESDPLFFKYQREEVTKQDWLDKVAEIKARWPE